MKLDSVKRHLTPYMPGQKRKTTIRHAFASATAPVSAFDQTSWAAAMEQLGQRDVLNLSCTYCERPAQTWDHLEPLVRTSAPSGHGHTLGNLVPSCKDCNSEKGNKAWKPWAERKGGGALVMKLQTYSNLAIHTESAIKLPAKIAARLAEIETQVIELLAEADAILQAGRNLQ